MAAEVDPYGLLGVGRNAGLEEIRQAYRKAALKYHPDRCPDDPVEAHRKFCELTEAYRAVSRRFGAAARRRNGPIKDTSVTPQDFARRQAKWPFETPAGAGRPIETQWHGRVLAQKFSRASVDETRVFAWFWVLALVLALAVGIYTPTIVKSRAKPTGADVLIWGALTLGTYGLVVAATIVGLICSRRIFWLIRHLGFRGRTSLPGSRNQRELPRSGSVNRRLDCLRH